MKFSFDAEGYRDNLAEQLKAERALDRDKAVETLEQERETLRYRVSEDIKKVKTRLGNVPEEIDKTKTFEEISTEIIKMEGSDGKERMLEVKTTDISDGIPDTLKLLYDIFRLATLDSKFNHETNFDFSSLLTGYEYKRELEEDWLSLKSNKFYVERKDRTLSFEKAAAPEAIAKKAKKKLEEEVEKRGMRTLLKKYLMSTLKTEDRQLFLQEEDKLGGEDVKRLHEISKKLRDDARKIADDALSEYGILVNTVTEGALLNKKILRHVVAAFGEEGYNTGSANNSPENISNLRNRFPHVHSEDMVKEKVFDVHNARTRYFWFHSGEMWEPNILKMMLFSNPENTRFKNEIKGFQTYGDDEKISDYYYAEIERNPSKILPDDIINAGLSASALSHGIRFDFKKDEPWLYVADWIVDPYHGRLYKITEKDSGE